METAYNSNMIPSIDGEFDILGKEVCNSEISKKEYAEKIISTIPDEYKKADYSKIPEKLKKIVKGESEKRGFYLTGPAGVGKTYIAWSIYKVLNLNCKPCYMVDSDTLFDNIRNASFGKDSLFSLEEVENYDGFLIIDDLGARGETDWTNNTLRRFLSRRLDWHRPTCFTSNLSLKEISNKFDDRIASRISGSCEDVSFEGKDGRLETSK